MNVCLIFRLDIKGPNLVKGSIVGTGAVVVKNIPPLTVFIGALEGTLLTLEMMQ